MTSSETIISLPSGSSKKLLETGEMSIQTFHERAQLILGEDFLGPDQIEKAFGFRISPENVPDIPFSIPELEYAKAHNQRLVYRMDKTPDGIPITIRWMERTLQPRFKEEDMGQIIYGGIGTGSNRMMWHMSEPYYREDTPRHRWSLVSNDVLPHSVLCNYLEQTHLIADCIRDLRASNIPLPDSFEKFDDAVFQLARNSNKLKNMMAKPIPDMNYQLKKMRELKINRLTRLTAVEVVYDLLTYYANNHKRLLSSNSVWTINTVPADIVDGNFITIGEYTRQGMVLGGTPSNYQENGRLGAWFSR